jgi:DNA mismatch repair ATPase MutS
MAHVVDGEKVTFLYKLERGPSPRSFGLNVARMAGLPRNVLEEAARRARAMEARDDERRRLLAAAAVERAS